MERLDRGATVTARIDHLIEVYQDLLIAKAAECWGAINLSGDKTEIALLDEQARLLFDTYAGGVSDAAAAIGDDNLEGIVRAFATHKKMAMTTFVMGQTKDDSDV